MKPSPPEPPFVYKPSGSTLHRDVTPAQNIPRSPPLSVPFSLLRSRLVRSIIPFTNLHDSVGRSTPRLSRLSSPVKFKFKSTFFFLVLFAMAAILRSLFGSSQSTTPAHGKAKTRSRTESTPAPSPYYVYTPSPGSTPSTSSSGTSFSKDQRTNSYNTPAISSSPLRYPTHDSRHSHEHSRPLYRASSHKPHPDMQGA
jgi:hypothetical protein